MPRARKAVPVPPSPPGWVSIDIEAWPFEPPVNRFLRARVREVLAALPAMSSEEAKTAASDMGFSWGVYASAGILWSEEARERFHAAIAPRPIAWLLRQIFDQELKNGIATKKTHEQIRRALGFPKKTPKNELTMTERLVGFLEKNAPKRRARASK